MTVLHRHQLVWLAAALWQPVLAQAWDPEALECLQHWAAQDLPLVVTRQPALAQGRLRLGLPAPARWGWRRLGIEVDRTGVRRAALFPCAAEVSPLLPAAALPGWHSLCAALGRQGANARVYGSHGWQRLTGLAYLHDGSDLDLLLSVRSPAQADAVVALLLDAAPAPRLDGELPFGDGAAVAWREWAAWRAGRVRRVIVKRLGGVALDDRPAACGRRA